MKREFRSLSSVREESPFGTPPHVLVVADGDSAATAVRLAEELDESGADTEVRFDGDLSECWAQPDAVIFAGKKGYRVARHHPVLEGVLRGGR